MKNIEGSILEKATLFTLTLCAWGNRAKASTDDIEVDSDKKRLSLSKRLIKSEEYNAIRRKQNELKHWCMERCMPSFLKDGIFLVKLEQVPEFETELKKAIQELKNVLIPAFLAVYPTQVDESRDALKDLFNQQDYPSIEQLRHSFKIQWNWITFTIPEALPENIKQEEINKLKRKVEDAQKEIVASLRAGFGELVNYAIERLKADPTGKKKVIKNAFLDNFQVFFDTFEAKNLMDDSELAITVAKAKEILSNVSPDSLRESEQLRTSIAEDFENVKQEVDKLIMDAPIRRFNFDEVED